jgi:hypothetical protein
MTALNIAGLCINIIGALLIFFNTPLINYKTYLYNKSEEDGLNKKAKRKNDLARLGALLLVVGFALQLASIICRDL